MQLGIDNTIKVMEDVKKLILDAVDLIKSGPLSFFAVGKILTVIHDVQEVIKDAPGAFPELKDLDENEVGQLSQETYRIFKDIISAVAGVSVSK